MFVRDGVGWGGEAYAATTTSVKMREGTGHGQEREKDGGS